jgi:hypothetical protein
MNGVRRNNVSRCWFTIIGLIVSPLILCPARALVPSDATLISTTKIWSQAPYNSFTDLEFFKGQYYCTFREATQHTVPPAGTQGGQIRVLRSTDLTTWTSVALMDFGINNDLRDPKLSVTPDNRLLLIAGDSPQSTGTRQSYSWSSTNGTTWSSPTATVAAGQWLWRVEWNGATGYGISYASNSTRLYKTTNGATFSTVVSTLTTGNEGAMLFRKDGTFLALIRRDPDNAVLGTSTGNYTGWSFTNTNRFVGGPNMIELPDGRIVVGGRSVDGTTRTSLMFLDPTTATLSEFMTLPSGGDTSYPGFVWNNNKLYVSYYSSHEGKASIYLSQVSFANVPEPSSAAAAMLASYWMLRRHRQHSTKTSGAVNS